MNSETLNNGKSPSETVAKNDALAFELKNYNHFHSYHDIDQEFSHFIGREAEIREFREMLINSSSDNGTFLVTGYRGSGKTSFVNETLRLIKKPFSLSPRFTVMVVSVLLIFLLQMLFSFASDFLNLSQLERTLFVAPIILLLIAALAFKFIRLEKKAKSKKEIKVTDQFYKKHWWEFWKKWLYFKRPRTERSYVSSYLNGIRIYIIFYVIFCILSLLWPFSLFSEPWLFFLFLVICFVYTSGLELQDMFNPIGLFNLGKIKASPTCKELKQRIGFALRNIFAPKFIVKINLGDKNIDDRHVFKLMVNGMLEEYSLFRRNAAFRFCKFFSLVLVAYSLTLFMHNYLLEGYSFTKNNTVSEFRMALSDKATKDTNNLRDKDNGLIWLFAKNTIASGNALKKNIKKILKSLGLEKVILFSFSKLITFSLFCFLIIRVSRSNFYQSNFSIFKSLNELNERIEAKDNYQSNLEIKNSYFSRKFQQSRQLPALTDREIEMWLIRILEDLRRLPAYIIAKPKFIFVFDELDKIDPIYHARKLEADEEIDLEALEAVRQRQYHIDKVLKNLKHIFTTAKAYFIFVAGREMYDDTMAEYSKSFFTKTGIFSKVFYVGTFLRDFSDGHNANIFSMTESLLCRTLIPKSHDCYVQYPSIDKYLEFLKKDFPIKDNSEEEEKIKSALKDFVRYLTYRGNGSPNKVIQLLEKNIHLLNPEKDNFKGTIYGTNFYQNFLVLDDYKQYHANMIANLATISYGLLASHNKRFGDKSDIAIISIFDYMLKFHKSAFARKDINIIRDVLDIKRSPLLKTIVKSTIETYQKHYLQLLDNGVFEFCFDSRIQNEIALLTKLFDEEAAALNFTLDETAEAKSYFRRNLKAEQDKYTRLMANRDSTSLPYFYSIGILHSTLASLYSLDEEFDNANIEYANILQELELDIKEMLNECQRNANVELNFSNIFKFIEICLRNALVYEKKQKYPLALERAETVQRLVAKLCQLCSDRNYKLSHTQKTLLSKLAISTLLLIEFIKLKSTRRTRYEILNGQKASEKAYFQKSMKNIMPQHRFKFYREFAIFFYYANIKNGPVAKNYCKMAIIHLIQIFLEETKLPGQLESELYYDFFNISDFVEEYNLIENEASIDPVFKDYQKVLAKYFFDSVPAFGSDKYHQKLANNLDLDFYLNLAHTFSQLGDIRLSCLQAEVVKAPDNINEWLNSCKNYLEKVLDESNLKNVAKLYEEMRIGYFSTIPFTSCLHCWTLAAYFFKQASNHKEAGFQYYKILNAILLYFRNILFKIQYPENEVNVYKICSSQIRNQAQAIIEIIAAVKKYCLEPGQQVYANDYRIFDTAEANKHSWEITELRILYDELIAVFEQYWLFCMDTASFDKLSESIKECKGNLLSAYEYRTIWENKVRLSLLKEKNIFLNVLRSNFYREYFFEEVDKKIYKHLKKIYKNGTAKDTVVSVAREICENMTGFTLTEASLNCLKSQGVPEQIVEELENIKNQEFIAGLKITVASLNCLKSQGVPNKIIKALETIKNQWFENKDAFLKVLESKIGKEQIDQHKSRILQHTENFLNQLKALIGDKQTDKYKALILRHAKKNCDLDNIEKIAKGLTNSLAHTVFASEDFNLYSPSFVFPYVRYARQRLRIVESIFRRKVFVEVLKIFKDIKEFKNIELKLEAILNEDKHYYDSIFKNMVYELKYNSIRYNLGELVSQLNRIKESHTQGSTFYAFAEDTYYLEGDFHDSYTHFNVACERVLLNTGTLKRLKDMLSNDEAKAT